jgi:hypothetical protein
MQVVVNLRTQTDTVCLKEKSKLSSSRKEILIMARLKRTSDVLEIARQRLAGLKEISPKPDFGKGLTLESYEAAIDAFRLEHDAYNGDLSALDERTNLLDQHEQDLADLNQRILAAAKAQYGPDSNEYEQVGGTRRSDRKRPERTAKPKTA